MSATQAEFSPYLQPAVDQMAISPRQAWDLELLMEMEWEPTREDLRLVLWVNHVNCPVECLQLQ